MSALFQVNIRFRRMNLLKWDDFAATVQAVQVLSGTIGCHARGYAGMNANDTA